jgi:SAM-dependent methyltransferase
MLLVGSAVVADGARFEEFTLPSLERVLDPVDVVLSSTGDTRGIAAVYNDFVRQARSTRDCEALVLLHDDVEIVDANFRAKILAAVGEDGVGVVGAVGGADLRSVAWWEARRTAGRVFETRKPIELGPPRADVDVVDGLLLAISPRAFEVLMFDEQACPRFHGYDVDYCLQARAAGLRVTVRPIGILHRTKGGYGDTTAFDEAADALAAKWSTFIRPATPLQKARGIPRRVRVSVRKQGGRVKRILRPPRPVATSMAETVAAEAETRAGDEPRGGACLACGEPVFPTAHRPLNGPQALVCEACGSGITWPPPEREVEGDGLWAERYGNARLASRAIWFSEGRKRVEWMQLYLPEGCLLEIGCGTGEFIKVAEQEGYDVFGIEPSEWAAQHARALDLPVETGFLSDWIARYQGLRPDGVCLWHVLEHVPAPLAFLQEIVATLAPGGYVFLEVPNFASSAAARLGMAWDGAQPADHFAHYTPSGLSRLLSRAGLEQVQLLPTSRRIYESGPSWRRERNASLLERHDWPPLDLLRGVARSPDAVAGRSSWRRLP